MNKKSATQTKAQEIFQILPTEKQNYIKNNEPEVYKTLFSDDILLDAKILDDFITRYQPELDISEKARMFFQKMSLGKQIQIQRDDPKMYNALFDKNNKDNSLLQQFIDKYVPLNETITTFPQFLELSLEDQLKFKQAYPDDYNKIISTEPDNE